METDELRDKVLGLFTKKEDLETDLSTLSTTIAGLEKEARFFTIEQATLTDTWNTLRDLLDKFSAESIGKLKDLLNKGIQSIFTDRSYEIKIAISDTKRKQMKMYLTEIKPDGEVIEAELNGVISLFGGGVMTVISFIFQVFLIVLYEKRRLMAIDEGLTNISASYIENFFTFLKYLHTEMGFDFIIVNHDPRMMPYMDKTYEVKMGKIDLKN